MSQQRSFDIVGTVQPDFQLLREEFVEGFERGDDLGASVAVWHQGELVASLAGGWEARPPHRAATQAWHEESVTTIFSCTKGLLAIAFSMLSDRGLLDYDAPLATYWPGLSRGKKGAVTVRTLLNHRAGFLGFDRPLPLEIIADDAALEAALEIAPISWEPGTRQGYHAITYGLYGGVLFRKVAGERLGDFLLREVADPLNIKLYLGGDRAAAAPVAPIYPASPKTILTQILPRLLFSADVDGRFFRGALRRKSETAHAFAEPAALGAKGLRNFNRADVRRLELPWANAAISARGLSKIYQAFLAGSLTPRQGTAALEPLLRPQSWSERDAVIRKPLGFSLGFIKEELGLFSPNPTAFGHPGAGGSIGWADPSELLSIAYIRNQMGYQVRPTRTKRLLRTVYRCLGRVE
ncbi:MAG: serine hydrolase domain-containing protein [Myxococcota bacterium]|nr:serine hydrolase domain-containing protein [Myxococcota bacterium]